MKRESRLLFTKAVDSLVLSIEHYKRPWDRGRVDAVLILLDHAFEMRLKAAILHRGGAIRKPREKQTLGFDECLRKALSDGSVQFLKQEQVLQLQALNTLRDAAQHHLVDLSEQHLYIHAQAGLTLFRDVVRAVFDQDLKVHLPSRVLPLSTSPPTDLATLFEQEAKEVQRLLTPGRRRKVEAAAKLRALAIVDGAMRGDRLQPTDGELRKLGDSISKGRQWGDVVPGVAAIELTATGTGPSLDLRISKKEGIPIQLVPEGTPGASVVAVHKVDSLGFYNLGRDQLATHLGLSGPKTTALIRHLKLQDDADCYRRITIGKTSFDRYSQKAIERMREALKTANMDQVWSEYQSRQRQRATA
ncbi:MAG: hypothetical protein Q8R92_08240 [Deltaproteobacteria bacterium]|nr:hypothetical protein [Deltaproteobacteria bacterium]